MAEVRKSEIGSQWRIAYAVKVRAAMGTDMCAFADAIRATFGEAKLNWLETPELTVGAKPEEGMPTQWAGERKRA